MNISKRYIFFVATGIVLVLIARPFGIYVPVTIFWSVVAVGLLAIDVILVPSNKRLTVVRAPEQKLYFKAKNTIAFSVRNTSRYKLTVEARDENLRHLLITSTNLKHVINPGKIEEFSYETEPSKRGCFASTKVYLRYTGVLGFCIKYAAVSCPIQYNVYPNVRDLSKYRLLMQKSRLLPMGDKSIRQYGMGADFESLRPYVDGDDYRKVNWPATARENKLIVNQYQIEREQPVYILLDIGRPMSYSVNGHKKLDYAINAAITLCDIVNQQGDKAGLMVFDSIVKADISPGQGALHRNNLLETLYHVQDNRQTANYRGAFQSLCDKQKRRSLVFIFTDFEIIEEAEDLITHIALLKRRHMPIVIFMENESLTAMAKNTDTPTPYSKLLKETAQEFHTERQKIIRKLNAMGIPSVESTAENFTLSAVNRYLRATVKQH